MKWFGRILFACAVFAVLLLAGSTLVQGPAAEKSADAVPVQANIAMVRAAAEPVMPELPAQAQPQRERAERTEHRELQMPAIQSDRNGQPIASRAWSRTMYLSCAPEGIPG